MTEYFQVWHHFSEANPGPYGFSLFSVFRRVGKLVVFVPICLSFLLVSILFWFHYHLPVMPQLNGIGAGGRLLLLLSPHLCYGFVFFLRRSSPSLGVYGFRYRCCRRTSYFLFPRWRRDYIKKCHFCPLKSHIFLRTAFGFFSIDTEVHHLPSITLPRRRFLATSCVSQDGSGLRDSPNCLPITFVCSLTF